MKVTCTVICTIKRDKSQTVRYSDSFKELFFQCESLHSGNLLFTLQRKSAD